MNPLSDMRAKRFRKSLEWDGNGYTLSSRVPEFTAPSNLVVTPSGTTNGLSWTNGTASAQTVIYRSGTQTGTYTQIGTVNAGVTSYNDTGLANGTYWYKVAHLYNSNSSALTTGSSGTISGSTGSRTLTGTGFGSAPTVLIFDRATGSDYTSYSLTADVGTWSAYETIASHSSNVRYITTAGRSWLAGRDVDQLNNPSANVCGLRLNTGSKYTEYYLEYRVLIPNGRCMPGASPNTNSKTWTDTDSRWKLAWAWNSSYPATTDTDCCYPTLVPTATLRIGGNAMVPNIGTSGTRTAFDIGMFSASSENILGTYIKIGSTDSTFDGTLERFQHNGASTTRSVSTDARVFYQNGTGGPLPEVGHDVFSFSAWSGNVDQTNVMHVWADMYLAVGSNAQARVYAHNAATLAGSSQVYNVTACKSAWSNTSITVAGLASRESLPYMSVIAADGTLYENVSWS